MNTDLIRSNAHLHTRFCDGKNTVEEMADAAYALGFASMGFSAHGVQAFDRQYALRDELGYIAEVRRVQALYEGRMKIWLGVEFDSYGFFDPRRYDYILGAVHYIRHASRQFAVDASTALLDALTHDHLGGDGLALARLYYDEVVLCARQLKPDILAHFDLIRKNNRGERYFSETSPEYKKIALTALEAAFPYVGMIEVNTGGMARGYLNTPYPDRFLLEAWREMGGRVIVTGDSHRVETMNYGFAEAAVFLRAVGFRSAVQLGTGSQVFEEIALA